MGIDPAENAANCVFRKALAVAMAAPFGQELGEGRVTGETSKPDPKHLVDIGPFLVGFGHDHAGFDARELSSALPMLVGPTQDVGVMEHGTRHLLNRVYQHGPDVTDRHGRR